MVSGTEPPEPTRAAPGPEDEFRTTAGMFRSELMDGATRAQPGDRPIDDIVDILAQVSLERLSVEPTTIGPFGAAVVEWEVEGPPRGFAVELNGRRVSRRGEQVVQPLGSTTYTVFVVAGGGRARLGSVDLTVDLSRCDTYVMARELRGLIEGALESTVEGGGIYLRSRPVAEITPGRITFRLKLGKDLDDKPDPTIRITGGFSLAVEDGNLVGVGETVAADVTVPRYVWLLPGAMVWLPLLLGNARQEAEAGGRRAIAGLVRLLGLSSNPASGMRRRHVRILAEDGGTGRLEVTECPEGELVDIVRAAHRIAAERAEGSASPRP